MNIITNLRRRIRIARISDARQQQANISRAYAEQMGGLWAHINTLQRAHVADLTTNGPTSSSAIAHTAERCAKRDLLGPTA